MSSKLYATGVSTRSLASLGLMSGFGRKVGLLVRALAEGKAAAGRYESLRAQGAAPGSAARTVFREHFAGR